MTDAIPPTKPRGPAPQIPARAAAVRGDNYQYAVAWDYLCRALTDPGIASISVEDSGAGQFDDVAVRRNDDQPDEYVQVKSSNSGDKVITDYWLTTAASKAGRSPLQHFHRTWTSLNAAGRTFRLTLLTNRGFDHKHPILGALRDNYDARIRVHDLGAASATSTVGICRDAWASHLGVGPGELLNFLDTVRWEQSGPEATWRENAKPRMRIAGLREDDEAVEVGIAIVRDLVMRGAGPQSTDELRRAVDQRDLLASTAQLTLAVNAIDRPVSPRIAHVTLDWVDRFASGDPWRRFRPTDPADWTTRFPAELARARTALEAYRARRVSITGASRLSIHFAVGNELADVRRWVLNVDQRGQMWATDATSTPGVIADVLMRQSLGAGTDLAVGIALTNDLTDDVIAHVYGHHLPVDTVLILGPGGVLGPTAIPSDNWLTAWTHDARETIRQAARQADRVHLFISAPASAALMLGHTWNAIPAPTTLYDFDGRVYFPTFQFG